VNTKRVTSQPRKPLGSPGGTGGQFDRKAGGGIARDLDDAIVHWDEDDNPPIPGDSGFDYENNTSWWPESAGDSSDLPLFCGPAWHHVLFGDIHDPKGGGHLNSVVQNRFTPPSITKTAYPQNFGAEQIGLAAALTLRASSKKLELKSAKELPPRSRHEAIVEVEGRKILNKVVLVEAPDGSTVITTYPVRGEGVIARKGRKIFEVNFKPGEK
jgi:hypothetical protein